VRRIAMETKLFRKAGSDGDDDEPVDKCYSINPSFNPSMMRAQLVNPDIHVIVGQQ
jgi:hypothetical protein